jgi:hypothetical protein
MENNQNENLTKSTSALNQDEIQMYLKDIRKIKVMTPERERKLSEFFISNNSLVFMFVVAFTTFL